MLDFPNVQNAARCSVGRVAAWGMVLAVSGGAVGGQAQERAAGLPLRNLVVEWRIAGQTQTQERGAGIRQGRVSIDSQRGVQAQGDVRAGSWQTESHTRSVQQLQVVNGGHARLFVGRSQPYTVWQWVSTQPAQAWGQTEWLDLGQGLSVRPRWPGGQAPVTVEFEAHGSQPVAYAPDGQIHHSEVASTVAVPLGEWTVVARSGSRSQLRRDGTLSTDRLDGTQSEQLEIRITAP